MFQKLGRVHYEIRNRVGGAMGAFFVYLLAFSIVLFLLLYFAQTNAFAPLSGSVKSPSVDNGFKWGGVKESTNQAWISLWALWFTVPITLISAIFAIKIATRAEELSEGERPEYADAFAAAQAYSRFKSMTVILPSLLRQAQRDDVFDGNAPLVAQINDKIAAMQESLLTSAIPNLLSSIAGKVANDEGDTDDAYDYLQAMHASLLYAALAKVPDAEAHSFFLRWMRRAHAYVGAVDSLIVDKASKRLPKSVRTPADMTHAAITSANSVTEPMFSDMEFWFIRHATPIAELNRSLTLSDFQGFRERLIGELTSHLRLAQALRPLSAIGEWLGKRDHDQTSVEKKYSCHAALAICLSDTGHADIVKALKTGRRGDVFTCVEVVPNAEDVLAGDKKKSTWILKFAAKHDRALVDTSRLVMSLPEAERYRIVLLLDQVNTASDSYQNSKYFSLSDHIRFWQMSAVTTQVIDLIEDARREDMPEIAFSDLLLSNDLMLLARRWRNLLGWPEDIAIEQYQSSAISLVLTYLPGWFGDCSINGMSFYKRDESLRQFEAASMEAGRQLDRPVRGQPGSDCLNLMMNVLRTLAALEEGWKDQLMSYIQSSPDSCAAAIKVLAKRPLLQRPVYRFADFRDGWLYNNEDISLDGCNLIGTAYVNSRFRLQDAPALELFTAGAAPFESL